MTATPTASSLRATLLALLPEWPNSWIREGYNHAVASAIEALRHLAEHPRPSGGQTRFNAESLLLIAHELEVTRRYMLTPLAETESKAVKRILPPWDEVNLRNGHFSAISTAIHALRFLSSNSLEDYERAGFGRDAVLGFAVDLEVTQREILDYVADVVHVAAVPKPQSESSVSNQQVVEGLVRERDAWHEQVLRLTHQMHQTQMELDVRRRHGWGETWMYTAGDADALESLPGETVVVLQAKTLRSLLKITVPGTPEIA